MDPTSTRTTNRPPGLDQIEALEGGSGLIGALAALWADRGQPVLWFPINGILAAKDRRPPGVLLGSGWGISRSSLKSSVPLT